MRSGVLSRPLGASLRRAGEGSSACVLTRTEALSMPRLLAAVLGAFLFWNAGALSESTPFRWALEEKGASGNGPGTALLSVAAADCQQPPTHQP